MVICDILLPGSDRNSKASMLIGPPVSIAIGTVLSIGEAGIFAGLV